MGQRLLDLVLDAGDRFEFFAQDGQCLLTRDTAVRIHRNDVLGDVDPFRVLVHLRPTAAANEGLDE